MRISLTRTLAITGASALALTAAACGTTDSDDSAADDVPTSGAVGCDTDIATSTDPVSLVDGLGRKIELDRPASRVAVLEWQETEDLISLCVDPVAVASPADYSEYVSAEKLPTDFVNAGERGEPDMDALYGADPDLIVLEAFSTDDELLRKLEARDVPVLVTKGSDPADQISNVKNVISMLGEATGRSECADKLNQDFDDAIADTKAKVADQVAALPTKNFLYFDGWIESGNLTIRPYTSGALMSQLGEELGLTSAWTDKINDSYGSGGVDPQYGLAQTDVEGLTAIGDANLFYTGATQAADDPDNYVTAMNKNPIWSNLPAVKSGRSAQFGADLWTGGGPRSNILLLEAYAKALSDISDHLEASGK